MRPVFPDSKARIYVVLNPISGHAKPEHLRKQMIALCELRGWEYEFYTTTGEENLAELVGQACEDGASLVVAAGGDGTVAGVVQGLANCQVPLAIIPAGTGNGLARALKIPLDFDDALQLMAGGHTTQCLDLMQVGERYFTLNVSSGISSRSMQETPVEAKRKRGILAYFETILNDVIDADAIHFQLTLDGHQVEVEASEVLVANGVFLREPPLIFGQPEYMSDQEFEVNILTAKEVREFVQLTWDLLTKPDDAKANMKDLRIRESLKIESLDGPQPVQADGELIGETPVEVRMKPQALRVLVPEREDE